MQVKLIRYVGEETELFRFIDLPLALPVGAKIVLDGDDELVIADLCWLQVENQLAFIVEPADGGEDPEGLQELRIKALISAGWRRSD